MKPIISVEGLGKRYTIRHEGKERYRSLREEIFQLPKRLWQRSQESREDFWALKDVTFDIMPGDRVGIIGRNGAGKSTLLKLLSRITEPTTGKITLRGRVASLLEVGTGFHPELTGRENIYLNGAILGMSRAEVRSKFDEIVDFAGVEQFLDTPVKRYSSGMYVRLAFAVAAHLEPEILIVDEVLAVGDAEFQKKCLGKMEEVGKEGRTVLFVSHNMIYISKLCSKTITIKNGRSLHICDTFDAIKKYIKDIHYKDIEKLKRKGSKIIKLTDIDAYSVVNNKKQILQIGTQINIDLTYSKIDYNFNMYVDIKIYNYTGQIAFFASTKSIGALDNKCFYRFIIPECNIIPGDYLINVCAYSDKEIIDWVYDGYPIKIINNKYYKCKFYPEESQHIICNKYYIESM